MVLQNGAMQDYSLTVDKIINHAAKWFPDTEVLTANEDGSTQRIGYAELLQRAHKVSAVLKDLGVKQGDRVATLAWNTQAHVEACYGIAGLGAACHTLNPRVTAADSANMLAQTGARIIICSADLVPLARDMAEHVSIDHCLVIDGDADWGTALEPEIDALEDGADWIEVDEKSAVAHCFTSGTTGNPKGVTYSHRATYLHTMRVLQADQAAYSARDSILCVVPMFHANAWGIPFAGPAAGAKLVLPGRVATGERLAQLIADEGVTVGAAVPTVWLGLVDYVEASGMELPSLQRVISGGAAMPPALMKRIETRLGAMVQPSWGMTELTPTGTMTSYLAENRSATKAGRPGLGMDLLLTDAEGVPLLNQRDGEGHLKVRGSAVIERYLGQDTPATDADGWFDTGDLARIDAQGNLMITGRSKDLIKSGGEWINPAVIEAIIGALPEVSLAAVIGRSDAKWGERPVMVVEMREQKHASDEKALLAQLKDRVASWWVPDAVIYIEKMPTAATGKVDKVRLREMFGQA